MFLHSLPIKNTVGSFASGAIDVHKKIQPELVSFKKAMKITITRLVACFAGGALCSTLIANPPLLLAEPGARQTLQGHVPQLIAGLRPLRPLEATNRLRLAIGLPMRDKTGADALMQQLYDPASPNFHHFLTQPEFVQRFGPTEADYQALQAFATANHLTVKTTHSNRLLLDVEGSVADIEKTFGVNLQVYQHPTEARQFFAPDKEPSLDLAIPVLHISGLDNFVKPRPTLIRRAPAAKAPNAAPNFGSGFGGSYWGRDFRNAYAPGVTLTGAGQTVGLLEFESGFIQSDITNYEGLAGLPNIPVNPVLIDGYDGSPGDGNDEVSLDIEMAVSMAPGLTGINVYEGDFTDDILSQMTADTGVKQFSASWTYGTDAESDVLYHELGLQGQSFFNSSGDGDADVGAVLTPTDDTNITVVGGTTLYTSGPAGIWTGEKVWNWGGGSGSTGGISTVVPIPPWQKGISTNANKGSTTFRNLPDVAMTADNVFVVSGGGEEGVFGGTSCATPLWAAFTALINQQGVMTGFGTQGFMNPAIYNIGKGPAATYNACFHDTVAGNNTSSSSPSLFYAVPGYDLCTGWGSPTGQPLIDTLAPDALVIVGTGLIASGFTGGPFAPTSVSIVLSNNSASSLTWGAGSAATWLAVSSSGGTLSPGQSTSLTVSLGAGASALPPALYSPAVWITNVNNSVVHTVVNTLAVSATAEPGTYASTLLSYHPIAYWPLNETTPVPAADIASNSGSVGVPGVGLVLDGVKQGLKGIVNNCAGFSNPTLDVAAFTTRIEVNYVNALNPAGAFTVEFWANPNQSPNDYFCPVSSIDDNENDGNSREGWIFYEASGNQWVFRLGNASGYIAEPTGGTVTPGAWQHVVGVYTGSTASLYINGVLVAGPTTASGYLPNANTTVPLIIGATSLENRTFDGLVDEVAVYSGALSASVIAAHYAAATTNNAGYGAQILASHPLAYWRLDEPAFAGLPSGTLPVAFNLGSLGNQANGYYQPGAIIGVPGPTGPGFGASNTACYLPCDSFIDVPNGSFLNLTNALTVSAWVQTPATFGQNQSIVSLGAGSVQLTVNYLGRAAFVDGTQSFGTLQSPSVIDDNKWHHLVGVYNGANTESLYVDGNLAIQSTLATVKPISTGEDLFIGDDPDPFAIAFFNGNVDQVAIFASALDLNQIMWLYATGYNATDISGTAGPPASGSVNLSWVTVPGEVYLLEYTTNLSPANWITLEGPVSATSTNITFTDVPGTDQQRFYRAVLAP